MPSHIEDIKLIPIVQQTIEMQIDAQPIYYAVTSIEILHLLDAKTNKDTLLDKKKI